MHVPVLLQEVIEGLAIKANGIYVDATFGRGGHSKEILKCLGPEGRLIAIDKDPAAIAEAQKALANDPRFCIVHASFAELKSVIEERGWLGKVDGILMDLGVSSPQLDDPERGFSFLREGPLDMRMDTTKGIDAATWINQASEADIANVLWVYGEERQSRRIARAIVEERHQAAITTTKQLADLIAKVCWSKDRHKHPATRSFQAIRIFVNSELEDLKRGLTQCLEVLSVGGRICVISFHSLEDGLVKDFIQKGVKGDDFPPDMPIKAEQLNQRLKKVSRLVRPTPRETRENPRARSARLRIAEKLS